MHGRITSNWRKRGDQLSMDVIIPASTTATVYVTCEAVSAITEGRKTIDKSEGVTFLRMEEGRAVFEVAAGSYAFRSEMN